MTNTNDSPSRLRIESPKNPRGIARHRRVNGPFYRERTTAPGTFEDGEGAFVLGMNRSEMHLVESEEKFRRGEFTGALEECNAALTAAETISAGFRGSYAARLTLARAIQERAVALEELGHVVDSLRERSLAEGVLQDAILEFAQVPDLFFTLSWATVPTRCREVPPRPIDVRSGRTLPLGDRITQSHPR